MAGKHLADATLIGFLDGELPGWSARTAAHHMAICSACRERMAELEEELALLNRNAQVNSISSKRIRCWQIGFATRVRVYEEKYHRSRLTVSGSYSRARLLGVAALVLIACLFLFSSQKRYRFDTALAAPLAAEFESAARRFGSQASFQRYEYSIVQYAPVRRVVRGQLSIWSDPKSYRAHASLRSEDGSFRYSRWRSADRRIFVLDSSQGSLPRIVAPTPKPTPALNLLQPGIGSGSLERVFFHWMEAREWQPQSIALSALAWRSVDGYNVRAELLPKRAKERIVLIEIQRSETRVLVKLVLRSRDDRPAIQQIWFSSPAGSYMLRVETKSIKVLQPFEIYSSLFEPEHPRAAWKSEDSPSASARTTGRAAHSRLSGPEQLEAEIQILYRLHQLKVCMGEAVELRRKPRLDELTISGRVVSAERRAQVISAVTPYLRPWIHLDLATNDELIARAAARVPHRQQLLSENTIISEGGVLRLSSPIRKAMERYLREDVKASSGSQDQEADRISLNILNHARLALKHAWALRHLSDRFPPASLQALPDSARSRLHELFSDHAEALGRELRLFRQLVIPIVGDRKAVQISPPGESNDVDSSDSRSRLLRAFFATEKLYGEVALLFARTSMGESDPGTAEPNIQQFITNLEQAETSSRLLAADLHDDEGTPTSLAQQRSQ